MKGRRGSFGPSTYLLLGAVALLVAVACGAGTATTTSQTVTMSVVFYGRGIQYYNDMISGMQDEANSLKVPLHVDFANFSVSQESDLVDNAVTQKPSGILVAPLDTEALIPAIRRAHSAGIPVLTVGDNLAADGQDVQLAYVGQSFEQLGEQKAQWLATKLNGHGTVITIHGPRGIDIVESQKQGYEKVFAGYPGIQVIEGPYGPISSDTGLTSTENMLTAHPSPDAIWFDNEDLAFGGIRALQERHIDPSKVITVSSDGTRLGLSAVKDGNLSMTVSLNAYTIGKTAVRTMYEYVVKHVTPTNPVPIPMTTITSANIESLPPETLPPGQQIT